LVSEYNSSVSLALLYQDNLLDKKIEAQRAGGLIEINILALTLIALHEQLVSSTEGRSPF
jgi:hypothetical protein